MSNCKIIHGDWLEQMRLIPDHTVHAIISDPPYGTTKLEWDKAVDWGKFWPEAKRVLCGDMVVLFSAQPFTTDLIMSNRKGFAYDLIWEKPMAVGFLDANRRQLRAHEEILVFSEHWYGSTYNAQKIEGKPTAQNHKHPNRARHYGTIKPHCVVSDGRRYPRSVIKFPIDPEHLHPTQKPLALMQWLVRTYSNPGDLILDPFCGSGSTGVACATTGRDFLGFEQSQEYCEIARERLLTASGKTGLFADSTLTPTGDKAQLETPMMR